MILRSILLGIKVFSSFSIILIIIVSLDLIFVDGEQLKFSLILISFFLINFCINDLVNSLICLDKYQSSLSPLFYFETKNFIVLFIKLN